MPLTDNETIDATAEKSVGGGDGKAVVTLDPQAAARVRQMREKMGGGMSNAEVVRRGLILLDLYLSLADDEELVVLNTRNDRAKGMYFGW